MCGRPAPTENGNPLPKVCPSCGGNWIVSEEYEPRYG
jgi:hypothetical protein